MDINAQKWTDTDSCDFAICQGEIARVFKGDTCTIYVFDQNLEIIDRLFGLSWPEAVEYLHSRGVA